MSVAFLSFFSKIHIRNNKREESLSLTHSLGAISTYVAGKAQPCGVRWQEWLSGISTQCSHSTWNKLEEERIRQEPGMGTIFKSLVTCFHFLRTSQLLRTSCPKDEPSVHHHGKIPYNQSNWGRKNWFQLYINIISQGSYLEVETDTEAMKTHCLLMLLMAHSACSLTPSTMQDHFPRVGTSHSGPGPPSADLLISQSYRNIFSSLFPNECQINIKGPIHIPNP